MFELLVKNYRCFPENSPLRIHFRSGITSLVGRNNAGKSAVFRFMHEFRALLRLCSKADAAQSLLGSEGMPWINADLVVPNEAFSTSNSHNIVIEILWRPINTEPEVKQVENRRIRIVVDRLKRKNKIENLTVGEHSVTAIRNMTDIRLSNSSQLNIPLLEELEPLSNTIYVPAVRFAVTEASANYFGNPMGHNFVKQWDQLKNGKDFQKRNLALSLQSQIARLLGLEMIELNPAQDGKSLQLSTGSTSLPLDEMGAGIGHIVFVLITAAIADQDFLLIDEPELGLHPSLQIEFLAAVAAFARLGTIFATHSYGLARATSDYIYSVTPAGAGMAKIGLFDGMENYAEFLGELQYSGYSDLGCSVILLVEGPKDVRVMHQFLRMLRLEAKVVVFPLGGDSLRNGVSEHELAEVKRISENVFAFVDSEKEHEMDVACEPTRNFLGLCERLGIKAIATQLRAIENYLTPEAIKCVKGDKFEALQPFERLKDTKLPWGKEENWRIAREMCWDDIKDTDLGAFLKTIQGVVSRA